MNEIPGDRREILIVDDSEADVELFERVLSSKNPSAVVHSASTDAEVRNFMSARKSSPDGPEIDLVIIDLNVPREGGLAILRDIKSDENLKKIPVIVMTGSTSDRDVESAYELGANSYLVKPVNFEEFSKVVGFIDSYWLKGLSDLPPHGHSRTPKSDTH